ncbi:MAG: hypothetical protein U0Q18_26110 [Bryobacteraceae bacterium]
MGVSGGQFEMDPRLRGVPAHDIEIHHRPYFLNMESKLICMRQR